MTVIRITISTGVYEILEETAQKLGKKTPALIREFTEQRMYQLGLIQKKINKD